MHAHSPIPKSSYPLLAQALAAAANPIFITDGEGRIVWVNDAFSRLTGYSAEDTLGHTPAVLNSGTQDGAFYADLWKTILSGASWHGELVDRRKDGSLFAVDETITPLVDENGAITHFLAIQHDITVQRVQREQEHHRACHDGLTGLPNRSHFLHLHWQAIHQARRAGRLLATLFIDLDKFKPVNDSFGHAAGDRLLCMVAARLRAGVRESDVVARIGGDEFAILLANLAQPETACLLADKLHQALLQPFDLGSQTVSIGASVGVALYPQDGDTPEALLDAADHAMYRAKCQGGGVQACGAGPSLH